MAGGPSQLELFDFKPKLVELNGQPIPPSMIEGKRFAFMGSSHGTQLLGTRRALLELAAAPRERLTRAVYNVTSFSLSAEQGMASLVVAVLVGIPLGVLSAQATDKGVNIATVPRRPEWVQRITEEGTAVLRVRRKVPFNKPNDFGIMTPDKLIRNFQAVTGGITLAMIFISSIALLVPCVLVLNWGVIGREESHERDSFSEPDLLDLTPRDVDAALRARSAEDRGPQVDRVGVDGRSVHQPDDRQGQGAADTIARELTAAS